MHLNNNSRAQVPLALAYSWLLARLCSCACLLATSSDIAQQYSTVTETAGAFMRQHQAEPALFVVILCMHCTDVYSPAGCAQGDCVRAATMHAGFARCQGSWGDGRQPGESLDGQRALPVPWGPAGDHGDTRAVDTGHASPGCRRCAWLVWQQPGVVCQIYPGQRSL